MICIPKFQKQAGGSSLNLLAEDGLEGLGISGELGDTLAEFLDAHLVLVEVEAEAGFVGEIFALGDVEGLGLFGEEFLGDGVGGVSELFEETGLEGA